MKLNYKLFKKDFLEFQLYNSSTSKNSQKTRRKSRLMIPIIYIVLGTLLLILGKITFGIGLLILAVLWYLFYPMYSEKKYKKHFEKHIDENYSKTIDKEVEISFKADLIEMKDQTSESKVKTSEIDKLIELNDHTLIIPKRAISDNDKFKSMIKNYNIDYLNQLDWKWK